ncbi:phosphoribosylaminoimidazolesuccinocarboxamide synthase [Candidatus Kaiserbacteria bacterium]|nr:phosphoribosylaminoimidazolesuccinocarboxamide synthase [Candidatus Kaiserbacteria bacterium]
MTEVLKETNFGFLGKKKAGKVRDIYEPSTDSGQGSLIFISTDRHSSFDRIIAHIPHKGQVLNQVSAWWFEQTKDIVPNHVLAVPDPNVTVGKKMRTIPIEAVVRGYLTGVTDTAIWTRYSKGERSFGDIKLPDGMKKNQRLATPVFDPTTKEEKHDRILSVDELISEGFVTKELFELVKQTALSLFAKGQEIAAGRGLILVDTKYEFGMNEKDELVLIDEIHTPDSSRYWQLRSYEEHIAAGEEPEYFDKEFLRLWFKEHCDPYKDAVLPAAPEELVEEMSRRYIQMYEQITGEKFIAGEEPMIPRMEQNLKQYAI